jgi:LacI family transcriptional regulator
MKSKEVTIYDIARELNLSIATVSRALKNDSVVSKKTKKKILDAAAAMGYRTNHFARNLRLQRTNTLGVIIPRLNSYFMSSAIAGIESVANEKGYNLIISQSSESKLQEASIAQNLFNHRVDGLLVSLAYDTTDYSHFLPYQNKNVPLVFFDRTDDTIDATSILIDNELAGYTATEHLILQGCKKIVHVTAHSVRNVYQDRLKGYQRALAHHQLPFNEQMVLTNNLSQEAGIKVAELLQSMHPRPDGVFFANDNCAVGCMVALKKAGWKIPEDIAVVGFNNDPVATVVEPNLTTIHYPGHTMGRLAANHLISTLNGSYTLNNANKLLLRFELIIRDSSTRT